MPNPELQRTSSRIVGAITNFCKSRLYGNPIFHMEDLRRTLANYKNIPFAPASPERILREMRKKGQVRYECINRPKSLYKILAVN